MLKALQFIDTFLTEPAAVVAFNLLKVQTGYLGGRILQPSPAKPGWRVQVFFRHDVAPGGWLPDGMQEVAIPESIQATLGIL